MMPSDNLPEQTPAPDATPAGPSPDVEADVDSATGGRSGDSIEPVDAPPAMVSESIVETKTARHVSLVLLLVAAFALVANGLLSTPPGFSEAHVRNLNAKGQVVDSWLKPVMSLLTFEEQTDSGEPRSAYATKRGIEIRNLFFFLAASVLGLIAGLRLLTCEYRPRLSTDDLLDVRKRASGPFFWWLVFLLVCTLTSTFSHAPDICKGQVVIRFLTAAWWGSLAVLLIPRHAVRLSRLLLAVLATTSVLGLWYCAVRYGPQWGESIRNLRLPQGRLGYPIYNSLWFGAYLLPGVFLGIGAVLAALSTRRMGLAAVSLFCLLLVLIGLVFTQSRSAVAGLLAGVVALGFFFIRRNRRVVVLAGLLMAIVGVWQVQSLRTGGKMGDRAHSIRARLDHEWPYAIKMFSEKPVGGHGDGCYAMKAGEYARIDQLEDPGVLSSYDETVWTAHAHNEILELLADVGIAGALSFMLAIVMTLVLATRACDQLADDGKSEMRPMVAGLAAALVAMLVEELSSVGLRHPGFPPVFFTVWACLWAMVRAHRQPPTITDETRRMSQNIVRLAGLGVVAASGYLSFYAVYDWQAARAWHNSSQHLIRGEFDDAIATADYAGEHLLDPLRKLTARMDSIRIRALAFEALLNEKDVLSDEDLAIANEAGYRILALNQAAPRFLQVSRTHYNVVRNLATAYAKRKEEDKVRHFDDLSLDALRRFRDDEPFLIDLVEVLMHDPRIQAARQRLWAQQGPVAQGLHLRDRLTWLRALLRNSDMTPRFLTLARSEFAAGRWVGVLSQLVGIARQDIERPPSKWQDALSPETLRIAAQDQAWKKQPENAVKLATMAEEMYEAAGGRLFMAHSAVANERIRFSFNAEPMDDIEGRLNAISDAFVIRVGPEGRKLPMRGPAAGPFAETRMLLLLASDREKEAVEQLRALEVPGPAEQHLAMMYVHMAGQFVGRPVHEMHAMRWADRALELAPDSPDAHLAKTMLLISTGANTEAVESAKRFVDLVPEKQRAYAALAQLEPRWRNQPIWKILRGLYPDFPDPPSAPAPTTQSTSQPAG